MDASVGHEYQDQIVQDEVGAFSRPAAKSIALGKVDVKAAVKPRSRACSSKIFSITRQKPCHGSGSATRLIASSVELARCERRVQRGRRRQNVVVDRLETVPMTAEQKVLATLIVEWMTRF